MTGFDAGGLLGIWSFDVVCKLEAAAAAAVSNCDEDDWC